MKNTIEYRRLLADREQRANWRNWSLPERAWGTVHEDYSAHGAAWGYFPHDHARSRVYRWNEGRAGRHQRPQRVALLWPGPVTRSSRSGSSG